MLETNTCDIHNIFEISNNNVFKKNIETVK